jgi:pyruvate/2-oxoglutarate dehydrogenase complex dihydrolipoamide acyltransferase (E2) component
VLALPAVRHFARQSGVDLALLSPGSGKNGRVERVDVERYLARGKPAGEQPSPAISSPPAEEDVVVELGRTRYGMWKAMEKVSKQACFLYACLRFVPYLFPPEFADTTFWVSVRVPGKLA